MGDTGSGVASRRRSQAKRASGRHLKWALECFQAASSHHTAGGAQFSLEALVDKIAALQATVDKLHSRIAVLEHPAAASPEEVKKDDVAEMKDICSEHEQVSQAKEMTKTIKQAEPVHTASAVATGNTEGEVPVVAQAPGKGKSSQPMPSKCVDDELTAKYRTELTAIQAQIAKIFEADVPTPAHHRQLQPLLLREQRLQARLREGGPLKEKEAG